jgi:AcrR family transcriptional regulator
MTEIADRHGAQAPKGKHARKRANSIDGIMREAKASFVARGYHGTRLEDVAASAGLSKGAVYFYFKDKEGLLLALFRQVREQVLEPLIKTVERSSDSPIARLSAFFDREVDIATTDPEMLLLPIIMSFDFERDDSKAARYVRSGYRRIERMLNGILTEGVASGEFRGDVSPSRHASILLALHDGIMLVWSRERGNTDVVVLIREMRATFMRAILA